MCSGIKKAREAISGEINKARWGANWLIDRHLGSVPAEQRGQVRGFVNAGYDSAEFWVVDVGTGGIKDKAEEFSKGAVQGWLLEQQHPAVADYARNQMKVQIEKGIERGINRYMSDPEFRGEVQGYVAYQVFELAVTAGATEGLGAALRAPAAGAKGLSLLDDAARSGSLVIRVETNASRKITMAPFLHGSTPDNIAALAPRIAGEAGVFDAVIHADASSFYILHKGKWVAISHRQVATWLKSVGYQGGAVRAIACQSGRGPAQHLANKLGERVWAATTDVDLIDRGRDVLAIPQSPGFWRRFMPGNK